MINYKALKSNFSCGFKTCASTWSLNGRYWTCSLSYLFGAPARIVVAIDDCVGLVLREILHLQPSWTCAAIVWWTPFLPLILCFLYWNPNCQTWLPFFSYFISWFIIALPSWQHFTSWNSRWTWYCFMPLVHSVLEHCIEHMLSILSSSFFLRFSQIRWMPCIFILLPIFLLLYFPFTWKAHFAQAKQEKFLSCSRDLCIFVPFTIVVVFLLSGP